MQEAEGEELTQIVAQGDRLVRLLGAIEWGYFSCSSCFGESNTATLVSKLITDN
jgi:hypothetical protein